MCLKQFMAVVVYSHSTMTTVREYTTRLLLLATPVRMASEMRHQHTYQILRCSDLDAWMRRVGKCPTSSPLHFKVSRISRLRYGLLLLRKLVIGEAWNLGWSPQYKDRMQPVPQQVEDSPRSSGLGHGRWSRLDLHLDQHNSDYALAVKKTDIDLADYLAAVLFSCVFPLPHLWNWFARRQLAEHSGCRNKSPMRTVKVRKKNARDKFASGQN